MYKAMITVCGEFGNKYWVSDLLLTCLGELCETLGRNGIVVEYADSMDNAQMRDPINSVEIEARYAAEKKVDFLFILYRDDKHENNLYSVFSHLREILPQHISLVLVAVFSPDTALISEEKEVLMRARCVFLSEQEIRNRDIPFLSTK